MLSERDVRLEDGRTLRVFDTGAAAVDEFAVFWHHGSPQTGALLEPLVSAAAARAICFICVGRITLGRALWGR